MLSIALVVFYIFTYNANMKISTLATLTSLLSAAGITASPLVTISSDEDKASLQEAIQRWQTTQECSPTYFTRTNSTLPASNHASYFRKWHKNIRKNPYNAKKSTYKLFASEHWGSLDFDCKAQFNAGCHVVPECVTIVKAIIKRGREKGDMVDKSMIMARTVYFVMQSFVYLNWDMHGRLVGSVSS